MTTPQVFWFRQRLRVVCQQVHITSYWCFESRELEKEDREQRGADAHISEFVLCCVWDSLPSLSSSSPRVRQTASLDHNLQSSAAFRLYICLLVCDSLGGEGHRVSSRFQASTGYVTDKLVNTGAARNRPTWPVLCYLEAGRD